MSKRKKHAPIEPINIPARVHDTYIEVLPETLYKGLKDTLVKDWLEWQGFYIPARPLLDLARIWKDEPYPITWTLEPESALLIIRSGRTIDDKFTSKTTLKLTAVEPLPEWRDAPEWAEPGAEFIPFSLGGPPVQAGPRPDAWISKAMSTDFARPDLMRCYGDFAADGFRAHRDTTIPPLPRVKENDWEADPAELRNTITRLFVQASNTDILLRVQTAPLNKAVKLARTANKETVHLNVNGTLECYGESAEGTRAGIHLDQTHGYEYPGPDLDIMLNPRFLIDALSGMQDEVIIGIYTLQERGGDAPPKAAYITDGHREALVMGKRD